MHFSFLQSSLSAQSQSCLAPQLFFYLEEMQGPPVAQWIWMLKDIQCIFNHSLQRFDTSPSSCTSVSLQLLHWKRPRKPRQPPQRPGPDVRGVKVQQYVLAGPCGSHAIWNAPLIFPLHDTCCVWILTWTLISCIKCFHSEVECEFTAMFCLVPERCLFSRSSNLSMDFSDALLSSFSRFWYEICSTSLWSTISLQSCRGLVFPRCSQCWWVFWSLPFGPFDCLSCSSEETSPLPILKELGDRTQRTLESKDAQAPGNQSFIFPFF